MGPDGEVVVVIDPVDGSTNAARGIPWFATSLCAVDADGPRAAVVVNQASGIRFEAVRGGGARKDGVPIRPSGCRSLGEAIVGFSGYPQRYFGWSQCRMLGAAALDLCAVAEGVLDGYAVVGGSQLGSWDYLGGMLVCTEAGAVVGELGGRELVTLDHAARRTPVAASTSGAAGSLSSAARTVALCARAFSSVGRAAGLQPAGHRFESGSAHHDGPPERGFFQAASGHGHPSDHKVYVEGPCDRRRTRHSRTMGRGSVGTGMPGGGSRPNEW